MKHLKKFESFNKINESQDHEIMDKAKLAFEELTPDKKEKVLQEVQQLADKLNCDVADLQDPKFVIAELQQVGSQYAKESKMTEGLMQSMMDSIMRGVGGFLKYLGIAVGTLGGLYSLVMSISHLAGPSYSASGIPKAWNQEKAGMTRTESFTAGWLYLLGAAVAVGAGYLLYKGGQATQDRWEKD